MLPITLKLGCLLSLLGYASLAAAHMEFEIPEGYSGKRYSGVLVVGHGCLESPTRQIILTVPNGVTDILPAPRKGWTATVQSRVKGSVDGAKKEPTVVVTWTARSARDAVPSAKLGMFSFAAQMPSKTGPLFWPISQVCAVGRSEWPDIPKPGQRVADLLAPAAVLIVSP